MNFRRVLIVVIMFVLGVNLLAQIVLSYEKPSQKELKKAVKTVLYKSSCVFSDCEERVSAMGVVQRAINNLSPDQWKSYKALKSDVEVAAAEEEGALYFYREAMEKVLKEVKKTKVRPGTVVLWNLYNMGYIVKTPSSTFAIDLIHKHIGDFAGLLDFALITHSHGDHGSANEFQAFADAGVPFYAGYNPLVSIEGLNWNFIEDMTEFSIGGVSIRCNRGDHNASPAGLNMITIYEIDCGEDTNHAVILHTGDCYNYEQINPVKPVDFFIFHSAVGLNRQAAIDKVKPVYAVFSHGWELGHDVEKWRWTIDDLLSKAQNLMNFPSDHVLIPCWGEKIVYKK